MVATLFFCLAAFFGVPLSARADLMEAFSVSGNVDADPSVVNEPTVVTSTIPQPVVQFVTGAWSQTDRLKDVSIDIWVVGTGIFEAFLTNQIGPGTTTANEIANSVFDVTSAVGPQGDLVTVFDGLKLKEGTYYLTIAQSSPDTGDVAGWPATVDPLVTGSPLFDPLPAIAGGSLFGGIDDTYLPGSLFQESSRDFQSTFQLMQLSGRLDGPLPSVPEPGSVLLLSTVFLGVIISLQRKF
jgi:hypothetical protein